MRTFLVTTAVNPPPELVAQAQALSSELRAAYAPRRNITISALFRETCADRLLIVERNRLHLLDSSGLEYAFHPNLALVRGLNLLRGERDLFAEATALREGESFLDCTLGFASEATLAALLVGEQGRVVGLESIPELAAVTRAGVSQFKLQTKRLNDALRRVAVVTADYREYLPVCASNAFDVVYFDPFFSDRLPGSGTSVSPLAHFGDLAPLDSSSVHEARRIASRRVVIKHPKHEPLDAEIASLVAEIVTTRKKRIQYDIILSV